MRHPNSRLRRHDRGHFSSANRPDIRSGHCRGLSPIPSEAGGQHPPHHVREVAVRRGFRTWVRNSPNFSKMPEKPTCKSPRASTTVVILARLFKIEHLPKTGVVFARRIVQFELVAEPGIVAAENLSKPVEYETDRAGIQSIGERDQVDGNRNPQVDFQRHRAWFDQRVAGSNPIPCPALTSMP